MVEVPSAALLADRMLEVVDFLSIGTNDLTQYAMAADRLASDLAHLTDPWQPAVLQLIATTAAAGQRAGKSVGVCGEAAADPLLAVALVGMGITSLSMASAAVRAVGAQLSAVSTETCRRRPRPRCRRGPDGRPRRRPRGRSAPADSCGSAVGRHSSCRRRSPPTPHGSRLDRRLASYGSTVTLIASPFLTIEKASRTSSSGMWRVIRSLTGT